VSASLALQKAIGARLRATSAVTSLVPSASILNRNARPNPDPSIIIGEGQEVDENRVARDVSRVYLTLHVWKKESGTSGVTTIAGAIKAAIKSANLRSSDGYYIAEAYVSGTRVLRDPDQETAHAVVTIESLIKEVAP
jgi:hypothetical protein